MHSGPSWPAGQPSIPGECFLPGNLHLHVSDPEWDRVGVRSQGRNIPSKMGLLLAHLISWLQSSGDPGVLQEKISVIVTFSVNYLLKLLPMITQNLVNLEALCFNGKKE